MGHLPDKNAMVMAAEAPNPQAPLRPQTLDSFDSRAYSLKNAACAHPASVLAFMDTWAS